MSGISLCDTCSNCECVFQSGVVREQCDFYKKKIGMTIDEIGYLAKALEEVNERDRIVKCNTIDSVIEIIDRARNHCKKGFTRHDEKLYLSAIEGYAAAVRQDILALKGEQK